MIWAFWIDSVTITPGILAGTTSLGGSESACLGLMRALAARGHLVHAFTPKIEPEALGPDGQGVAWHDGREFHGTGVYRHTDWDCVVGLRMPYSLGSQSVPARYRILWNQDLLYPAQGDATMGALWQTDTLAYVSAYQRAQWEQILPHAAPLGWVTRNGYDPTLVPTDRPKRPNRLIHVSRPERALVRVAARGQTFDVQPGPLLQMWPAVRAARLDAELALCRYSSMYDAQGWGQICAAADEAIAAVHEAVGGIVWLGELGKPDLYAHLSEAAALWYPGLADFAETACIAAIEAQACGTPVLASHKGALPETAPLGLLIAGDAETPAYQAESVAAVLRLLDGCAAEAPWYQALQAAGRAHVNPAYTYDALAAEWEAFVLGQMDTRRTAAPRAVLDRLLIWDDHTAARPLAEAIGAADVVALCDRVIAGEEQTAEDYADRAVSDPITEAHSPGGRFDHVVGWYAGATRLLDVACGNGALAIKLAALYPELTIVGVDYSARNIERATEAAASLGYQDRVTFVCLPVYDFATQAIAAPFVEWVAAQPPFDAAFVGEFLEHVANIPALVDGVEAACAPGALVGYTMPRGPFSTLLPRGVPLKRGHVHAFELDDVLQVFGEKADLHLDAANAGVNKRTYPVGHWLLTYRVAPGRGTAPRDLAHRVRSTRPWPRLSALIIAANESANLATCLQSIWGVADEIVVGDCGSTDETSDIAARYGAKVISLPAISAANGFDFSDARNAVLACCRGDWVLWIDADETLEGGADLGKYLESGPFTGYAIAQVHLALDLPPYHDLPVRCFRRIPSIRWYGSIHEQPQMGDSNTDIWPALHLPDVQIAHRGYTTQWLRTKKRKRNLPLLELDRQRYPERRLGLVLWIRDLVQEAQDDLQRHGGRLSDVAASYLTEAIDTFEAQLADPADKLYAFARPWYEQAVKLTTTPWEFGFALVGQPGGLNGNKPAIQRVWVRSPEQIGPIVSHELAKIAKATTPQPILLDWPPQEQADELAPE